MRRIDVRSPVHAHLLQNGYQLVAERAKPVLGLPYVCDAEALRAVACDVREQAFHGPVGGVLHAIFPRQPAAHLPVDVLGETWRLKYGDEWHGGLHWERGAYGHW